MSAIRTDAIIHEHDSVCVYLHSNFTRGLGKTIFPHDSSRSSKFSDFGTNRKRVCNFLFPHSKTLVLSCTVSEILQVVCAREWPHPYILPYVPVASDHPCFGEPEQKPLAIRPYNYFRSIPTYVIMVPERYRRTELFGSPRSSKVILVTVESTYATSY